MISLLRWWAFVEVACSGLLIYGIAHTFDWLTVSAGCVLLTLHMLSAMLGHMIKSRILIANIALISLSLLTGVQWYIGAAVASLFLSTPSLLQDLLILLSPTDLLRERVEKGLL